MIKQQLRDLLGVYLKKHLTCDFDINWIEIEIPKHADHGHFSMPISFRLASLLKQSPAQIADDLVA